jgi:hypothetical protein
MTCDLFDAWISFLYRCGLCWTFRLFFPHLLLSYFNRSLLHEVSNYKFSPELVYVTINYTAPEDVQSPASFVFSNYHFSIMLLY